MPNNDYANEPNQSRSEDIIQSILDNTEYDEAARSRIEYLLIELKNAIEGGGGGGGVTSYSPLTEKPKIDNHTLQAGNNTSSDLGLQTKLTFDSTPTESSTNPVTSGGVYTAIGTKANSSDVYNKSAVDTALGAKADKSTTYTKTEVDTALATKQDVLTTEQLAAVNSGVTSADVEQITTNKNNILLSLIMPFATNNYNVSNLSVKANATIDTSTGIITQTTTDTQANLRFQMSAFNGTTLARYLTENIIMTNNGIYYLTFTKSSDYDTLVFGHNGSAADFKVALPVSALSNGDYIFKINILNCIQGNGAYSFSDIAILKKTGAYII